MNVLIVNTAESQGGAAIAASRLLHALREEGVNASMVVRDRSSDLPYVHSIGGRWKGIWKKARERFDIWRTNGFSRKDLWRVSTASTGFDLTKHPDFQAADVIHLHWVNQGLLSLCDIQKIADTGKPIVWTLHDMWPLTGICHHAYECKRYREGCYECPLLRYPSVSDLSAKVYAKKMKSYGMAQHIKMVAVSTWLAERARLSSILAGKEIRVIANALPVEDFQMLDPAECRKALGLPQEQKVLLFGAARIDDPIKGFAELKQALHTLIERQPEQKECLHLLLFGEIKEAQTLVDLPIAHTHIGVVSGAARLSQLYSAATLTLSTSHYETFGQTLAEALACGCPVVAFDGSGTTDIVRHHENGYLAHHLDTTALCEGICWTLEQATHHGFDRAALRADVVARFSATTIARQHIELYQSLL